MGDHLIEAKSQLLRAARLLDEGTAKQALEKAKQSLKQDLEAAGAWTQLGNQKDPMLQELAKEVPATLLSGKADSTAKK